MEEKRDVTTIDLVSPVNRISPQTLGIIKKQMKKSGFKVVYIIQPEAIQFPVYNPESLKRKKKVKPKEYPMVSAYTALELNVGYFMKKRYGKIFLIGYPTKPMQMRKIVSKKTIRKMVKEIQKTEVK